MCSLGIEPTTFALLKQCSTTEPQEHNYSVLQWNMILQTFWNAEYIAELLVYTVCIKYVRCEL